MLICSVGTEIFYRGPDGTLVPDTAWTSYLDKGWDKDKVQQVAAQISQLKPQVRTHTTRVGNPPPPATQAQPAIGLAYG